MSFLPAITSWLKRNRTSVRIAFVLRMIAMILGSLFSLLWYRLLLWGMGDKLMGLFQSFQGLTRLGGLGDLGVSGALSIRAGTMLGRRDDAGLQKLLASARTLFLLIAGGLCLVFVGLSPWLPKWLNFIGVPGAGSMTWLFVYGGITLGMTIVGGYFACLNYANGTVTWPIFPGLVFMQLLAPFLHWRLALLQLPLWIQLLPYLGCAFLFTFVTWRMLKWSHPWLGDLLPLSRDSGEWKSLSRASGWVYLITIGNAIYFATDRLVIGAVMGTEIIPTYQANYKVCELAMTLIVTAAFVGLPKLTQWIASPHEADRRRLLVELNRLSVFEIVLGCGAVLGYLAFNNLFIHLWLDKPNQPSHQAPLAWQCAFACNLAVSVCGNAGIQFALRAGDKGLKWGGLVVAGTGFLNLGLSILSVKFGSITGVAVATVIAQSISSVCLGIVTCRYLKLSTTRWVARCWLLPVCFTLGAAALKIRFPDDSLAHLGLISVCYIAVFLVVCWLAGMTWELLRAEMNQARGMFLGKK